MIQKTTVVIILSLVSSETSSIKNHLRPVAQTETRLSRSFGEIGPWLFDKVGLK